MLVPLLLLGSWIAMLALMRIEFWTVPPPEALARERMVRLPTPETLRGTALRSTAEVALLLLATIPGRAWVSRVALAGGMLALYFVLGAPLSVTSVEQVHRRWLALVALALLATAAGAALVRLARRLRRRG
jgi:hypothetical protein